MNKGPQSWPEVSLGDICEFRYGKSLPEEERNKGDFAVFGSNGVVGSHDKSVTHGPTIVIGRKGSFGEIHFSSRACWPIDTTYYVDGSSTKEDLRWLMYRLSALGLTKINRSKTIPGLNREDAYRKRLFLPPLAEQRRIAEVLDRAEELQAARRATLAELDTLTQNAFLDLFCDPALPEPTIGDLLESGSLLLHKDGNHGSLYPRADDFGDEGIPFLSAKAVTDDGVIDNALVEHLREEKAEKLTIGWISKGDVLLAHNASVGKVALYDGRFERALIGTSLTAFRPNPEALDPLYLAAALRSVKFQRQLEGNMGQTTRNQVPITAQRRLRIVEPPISLQREFSRRIGAVEKLKATYRAALAELDALFASLQYRAFRGEL